MLAKKLSVSLFIGVVFLFVCQSAPAHENSTHQKTYTTSDDFNEGDLVEVNHDPPDQLQLNSAETPFSFVNVAASARDTIVRIKADTGEMMGEYRTAPKGRLGNPSRTTVDRKGNVWTANRDEDQPTAIGPAPSGSVVKIGIVIGGIRVTEKTDAESGETTRVPALLGEYLQGPFDYNTCVDRDGDDLIRTSSGLGDILGWPGSTDQTGGEDGIVEGAEDECILLYQRLPNAPNAHHVSVDAADNIWVGGYPEGPAMFYKLDGQTASVMDSFDTAEIGCGGFGGLVDAKGVIWSAGFDYDSVISGGEDRSALLYYDPVSRQGGCIAVSHSYGLAADSEGFIWNSMWIESGIVKINQADHDIKSEFQIEPIGESSSEGVAVTPDDNNVWVARAFGQPQVSRLDKDGKSVSVINLLVNPSGSKAQDPTGVAVDANGKVWVTNLGSDNVMRIDPTGGDGYGAVDMVVDLGTGAVPDNYSDMTGKVVITDTSPEGTWTVIHDSGTQANMWDTIIWNTEPEASVPEGAGITVEARVADVEEELDGKIYHEVFNGELLFLTGRFIQIRATLTPNSEGESPILFDLTVVSVPVEETGACKIDEDDDVDIYDILPIYFSIGAPAEPGDPRDWDGDGAVTWDDAVGCVSECTYRYCWPHEVQ